MGDAGACEHIAANAVLGDVCCSIAAMKNMTTIVSTLIIGLAFALGACGKKDAAKAEAPKTEPAATETKPADPATATETKPEEKKDEKAGAGW